ncbi:hypothetical protein B0I37DRAFT_361075 [Chaetomium sp. MPI-CAGE-AT-0009]|nr:hypothetical protein B0I37DRAFT_361075 [Chaetomium sp. MPI-CAGE-AT-0009]
MVRRGSGRSTLLLEDIKYLNTSNMDRLTSSTTPSAPEPSSALSRYIYDTSSVQERLLQPVQKPATDRLAALTASVNASMAALSSTSTPDVGSSSRL